MKFSISTAALAIASLIGVSAAHATTFPGYGNDSGGPGYLITVNANNSISFAATGQPGTYDGADDTYIGVINNSGHVVNSLNLSSSADIFGFDSDGIDIYGAPSNLLDTSGYGGPDGYFTNIVFGAMETGTVNFIGGIAGNGGSDYFSLEEALSSSSLSSVPEPATWALMLVGFAGLGGAVRARRAKIA